MEKVSARKKLEHPVHTAMGEREGRGVPRDTQHRRRHERSSTAHGNSPIYRLTRATSARDITRYR